MNMAEQNPSPAEDHAQLVSTAPRLPEAVVTEQAVAEDEEVRYIRVPPVDGGQEVLVPARPLYDALAQLSFTLHNGNGWTSNIEAIAWYHLGAGIDPFEDYIYSTYEEVLVDLYVVAALCIPYGWWPVEADEEDLQPWMSGLQAVSWQDWNQSRREQGYLVIDDPGEALQILAAKICGNPAVLAEYERKCREGLLPADLLSVHDARGACTQTWTPHWQEQREAKARQVLEWLGVDSSQMPKLASKLATKRVQGRREEVAPGRRLAGVPSSDFAAGRVRELESKDGESSD